MTAERLKPFHVEEWVSSYDFSVTSRRNYFRSVKRCYRWGKRQGYFSKDPIADLEVPRAEQREVVLTQAEFDELIGHARNQNLLDLINVTWLTGWKPRAAATAQGDQQTFQLAGLCFFEPKLKVFSVMARPRKPWFRKSNKCWYVEINGKQVNLGPDRKLARISQHLNQNLAHLLEQARKAVA